MTEMQAFGMELVCSIIEMQFVMRYYFSVYGSGTKDKKKLQLAAGFLMLLVTCLIRWFRDPFRSAALPLFTVAASLLLLPLFPVRRDKKLLFSLVLIGLSGAWTLLSDLLLTPLENKSEWLILLIFHGGFCILLELIRRIGRQGQEISRSMWLLLLLMAGSNIFIITVLFLTVLNRDDPYARSAEIPVLTVMLLIDIALLILFDRFAALMQKIREQSLLEQQLALQQEHYRQLEDYHRSIAALHHDMGNQLDAALYLMETEQQNGQPLAALKTARDKIKTAGQLITTGNPPLDAVLNLKLSQLSHAGICCRHQINIPAGLSLSFEECVVILGNLLDNAREACEKLPKEERQVRLTLFYQVGTLYIKVENKMEDEERMDNGPELPGTTKPNAGHHGFGLKNVKDVVEKRGAFLIDRNQPGIFCVRITLYDQ